MPYYSLPSKHRVFYKLSQCPSASSNPLVLLSHGSCQELSTFDGFVSHFKDTLSILRYDLRGHGNSDHAQSYVLKDFSQDLLHLIQSDLVKSLKYSQLILVGMSLGGLATLDVVCQHPQLQIDGFVMIDITPNPNSLHVQNSIDATRHLKTLDDFVKWAKSYNPHRSEEKLRERLKQALREDSNGIWTWKYDRAFVLSRQNKEQNNVQYLWKLAEQYQPKQKHERAMLVHGKQSKVTTPKSINQLSQALMKGSDREWVQIASIDKAGHSAYNDQPEAFSKFFGDFAESLSIGKSKL